MVAFSELPPKRFVGTILVVDDESLSAAITARMFTSAGYTVVEALNARDALLALEQAHFPIDLVVTDVVMPETDGPTLGRLIRERHPKLPVIYVSPYPPNDVHGGSPNPLVPFLQKPFLPEALLSLVHEVLPARAIPGHQQPN